MVFSFHGNTPRNPELKLPVFTGLNVTRDLDASFVARSDPSLYLDPNLKLAWFSGSSGWNLQTVLKQVLRKIVALRKKDPQQRREEEELLELYLAAIGD